MFRTRTARGALVLVFIAATAMIVGSYVSRRGRFLDRSATDLLSPDISRQSTDFHYSQLKGSRTVFEVHARRSTVTTAQVHDLEEVRVFRFDVDGKVSDTIEAEKATYLLDQKKLDFAGQVVIRLVEGIRIDADRVNADLGAELVDIPGQFSFAEGGALGSGQALHYRIEERNLQVRSGFRLKFPETAGGGTAGSRQVTYRVSDGLVKMEGDARVVNREQELTGDTVDIVLTPDSRPRLITATGKARLAAGPDREFRGPRIDLAFAEVGGAFERFDVAGSGEPGPLERVAFRQGSGSQEIRIEAVRLEGLPEAGAGDLAPMMLASLVARDKVVVQSTMYGIDESRAKLLEIKFLEGNPERVRLRGQVEILRRPGEGTVQELLTADEVELEIGPGGNVLSSAEARVSPELRMLSPEFSRRLYARDSILSNYREGVLERAVAVGDCRLEGLDAGGSRVLRANRIEATFKGEMPDRVVASQRVALESLSGQESQQSSSGRLELQYRDGKLQQATQSGDFRFSDRQADSTLEILADRGEFDFERDRLTATGRLRPQLKVRSAAKGSAARTEFESSAVEIVLDRKSGQVTAAEKVESVMLQDGQPLIVTAGEMCLDAQSGKVIYTRSPRLVQGVNVIRGSEISIDRNTFELEAQDKVETLFVQEQQGESREFRITADTLHFRRSESRASYSGAVQLVSEALNVQAPFIDLIFAGAQAADLERVEAWGGVRIEEKGRKWNGRRATYFRLEDKVTVTGEDVPTGSASGGGGH